MPALIELLKDKSSWTRLNAALALRKIAPEASAATATLKELLRDPDADVRANAAVRTRSGKEEQRIR